MTIYDAQRDAHWYHAHMDTVLLPYQQEWIADRSPVKVFEQSRKIGITWATACEAVDVASLPSADGGSDVWMMTGTLDDAREFISDCAWWIGTRMIDRESIMDYKIEFPSGYAIHAMPSRPSCMRGKTGYA